MSEGKKGLPIWAWFGIGCAGLLVLVMIALLMVGMFVTKKVKEVAGDFENNPEIAAARLIVKLNPEIEEVEVNEDEGTITVRNKKSGEIYTADVDDLKEGRFTIIGEDGKAVITAGADEDDGSFKITADGGTMEFGGGDASDVPSWIPILSGAEVEPLFTMSADGVTRGSVKIVTDKGVKEVLEFYRKEMEKAGFEIQTTSYSGGGESVDMVNGQSEDPKRSLTVNVTSDSDGKVNAAVTYSEGE
ncbi:MAG: hypothetical protein DRJ61_12140 [Acidobacteria bacterium]|nr:MAG: hypothetical protein DRJ61_12140 [Acidobacteriota bacterium]